MLKNNYNWLKRELLIGFYFTPFIAFCLFGVDFKNSNLLIFQIVYLIMYAYFSFIYFKNTIKSDIPSKYYLIEFLYVILMPILIVIYTLIFVDVKYIDGEYNGASLSYTYILIIFIILYVIFAIFATKNTKGYL